MFFERMIQLLIKEKEQFLHMTWREKLRIEITHYDFNTEFYFEIIIRAHQLHVWPQIAQKATTQLTVRLQ